MNRRDASLLLVVVAVAGWAWYTYRASTTQAQPTPPPTSPNHPIPLPAPPKACPRCPGDEPVETATAQATRFHAGGPEYSGEAITCDLPTGEHLRNAAGRDGLGLCVFTSLDLAARWANESAMIGFRDYMTRQSGGGWPEKVDTMIPQFAKEKGLPVPGYVQHTGGDPAFLRLALKTGRYVCATYNGHDGTYYRGPINHMINLVHFSDHWAVIQDNNFPGQWLWMTPDDFLSRWRGAGGWAIVLLKPGPPPIPVNRSLVAKSIFRPIEADCPGGNCPVKNPLAVIDAKSRANLRWLPDAQEPGYLYLFDGATQLGTWYADGRGYHQLATDGTWSGPCEPPIALPHDAIPNYGLEAKRIPADARYHLNGRQVTRQEAFAAFGGLADDSKKMRLTIVGDPDLRKRVLHDLTQQSEWLQLGERYLVQDYPPDHWAVSGVGFAPGITVQAAANADGKAPVLFRLASYSGPEPLLAALRKADPNYRADQDPDPGVSRPSPTIDSSKIPPAVWLVGGLLGLGILVRKKEPT